MSSRFLNVYIEEASFALAEMTPRLRARQVNRQQALEVCRQYRRRGIASLLLRAEAHTFHRDLQRSGAAYAAFLDWVAMGSRTVSKATPFFDAVASGDTAVATLIAERTATDPGLEEEYEDDFLYFRWLMGRFYLRQDSGSLDSLLNRYETLLDGAEDVRWLICKALQSGDPQKFDAALQTLISQREADYADGMEADDFLEEEWATEGYIFVEGLALLRLALQLGFALQREYLFIPSQVVRSQAASFDAAAWMSPNAP
jgi:hypothetical protein